MRLRSSALCILLAAPFAAAAQPADLEARLRALEARVAALEGRSGAQAAPASAAVSCTRLNVNGSAITPASTLIVSVNGTEVARYDANAYGDLERHLRPGSNRVGLAFTAPGTTGPFGTNGDLRCLPPNVHSSRTTILRLQPTRARLAAEVEVNYVPR